MWSTSMNHIGSSQLGQNSELNINELCDITSQDMSTLNELFPNPVEFNIKNGDFRELHQESNFFAAISRILEISVVEIGQIIQSYITQSKPIKLVQDAVNQKL